MPRCDCAGGQCGCVILPGPGIGVSGAGSTANPYVITANLDVTTRLSVVDTATVDMSAAGSGTEDDPLVLSAVATVSLDELTDVDAATPAGGDTIVWDAAAGRWVTQAPAVVPPGTVNVGPGLAGTGSVDSPLRAATSGVWGVDPLDGYGNDSTVGLPIYVDSNGQLRAEPREPESIAWDDVTGKPTSFPTSWDDVTGKPTSWPLVQATSGVITAVSGWAIDWQYGYRTGQVATVSIRVTRTGGTINVPASGNITNTRIANLTAPWRPFQYGPMSSTSTGPMFQGMSRSDDGGIFLTATLPNQDITRGESFSLAGTWVCTGS